MMSTMSTSNLVLTELPKDLEYTMPPEIDVPALKSQVFTHSSYFGVARAGNRLEIGLDEERKDYEKLEHVGDAILGETSICLGCCILGLSLLGLFITTFLHERYPTLPPGPATVPKLATMRNTCKTNLNAGPAFLFRKPTLAQLAEACNLPENLRADPSAAPSLRANANVQASLFEAYIAGLFYADKQVKDTQGTVRDLTYTWLESLFRPIVERCYDLMVQTTHLSHEISTSFHDGTNEGFQVGISQIAQCT